MSRRRTPSKRGACRSGRRSSRGPSRPAGGAVVRRVSHVTPLVRVTMANARVGNKGRLCHLWWRRGERPPGVQQLGYKWAYIFTAIRPATGEDVTLVLPAVNPEAMQVFLDQVAASRPPDAHVVIRRENSPPDCFLILLIARRRRLAPEQGSRRAQQHHARCPASLQPRTQP